MRLVRALGLALLLATTPGASAEQAPFLWKVAGEKANHYLMGSIHLLPKDVYPLPAPLMDAYERAEVLVLETDLKGVGARRAQRAMQRAGKAEGGLQSQIAPNLYADLQQQLQDMNLKPKLCDKLTAWFCALKVSIVAFQQAGMKPSRGLDLYFFKRADGDDKPVFWLESAEFQLNLFAGMPQDLGEKFLRSTVDELSHPEKKPADLIRYWREHDLQGMRSMVMDMRANYPKLHARLLADRNRAWIAPLKQIFASERSHLVLVGAAHMLGPEGLIALLSDAGYRPLDLSDANRARPER
ncbi:MAG: TraB/GumN family protein [Panacagrimonas sp.]